MERDDKTNSRSVLTIGAAILLVQLVDILIHVLTDQAESIRILSNIIIIAWILSIIFSFTQANRMIGFGALILYLLLNIAFLFLEGLLNSYGAPRIMFFILIILTSVLSIFFMRKTTKP